MASHPPAFFHPSLLALPLGELSPKVTERACRAGPMCPAVNYRPPPCHVVPRRPAGPTWARHQPPGLPNARSLCVRLESASPSESPPPTDLALPLGELSPKVTERACRAGPMCPAVNYRPPPCHVVPRRPAGPTWARHQPPGLPNARSLCVRLESASPSESPPPTDLALPLGELSPKVTERAPPPHPPPTSPK